jgi:hypothetical protein
MGTSEFKMQEFVRKKRRGQGRRGEHLNLRQSVCHISESNLSIACIISCKAYRNTPEASGALTDDEVLFRVLSPCFASHSIVTAFIWYSASEQWPR